VQIGCIRKPGKDVGANPALSHAVLPRTAEAGALWADAEELDGIYDFCIEIATTIKDQIAGRKVVRKGFTQLLNDPRTRWMPCHV